MSAAMGEMPWEFFGGEEACSGEQALPPGFRFHPTDEELITFYLASKVLNGSLYGVGIMEVDLNKCEPWELPEMAKMGDKEWYFFSLRDRKYPTGLRTNRATSAGYWKATGKDREVRATATGSLVGMKKTLVFYKGRAPRGEKTKWILHEYRLYGDLASALTFKEEWVICRILHKHGANKKNPYNTNPSFSTTQCVTSFPDPSQSLYKNELFMPSSHAFSPLLKPQFPPEGATTLAAAASSFLEASIQNPLLCDMSLGASNGVHFAVTPSSECLPMMEAAAYSLCI